MAPDDLTIRALDLPGEVDRLRPLWLALRDHHHDVAPELGPVRGDEDTWARRRADYLDWVANADAFCLVAEAGAPGDRSGVAAPGLLGYAMVRLAASSPTWDRGRIGDVETLSVAAHARGRGVGRALLDAARARLSALGIERVELTAVAVNADALRFYEREGLRPRFVVLEGSTRPPAR